jgi:hypothetical protein
MDTLKGCRYKKYRKEIHAEGCTCLLEQHKRTNAFWELLMRAEQIKK